MVSGIVFAHIVDTTPKKKLRSKIMDVPTTDNEAQRLLRKHIPEQLATSAISDYKLFRRNGESIPDAYDMTMNVWLTSLKRPEWW